MDKKASQTSRRAISAGCNIISKEIAQASRWNSNLFEPLGELFEFPTRQAIDLLILFAAEDLAREMRWLAFYIEKGADVWLAFYIEKGADVWLAFFLKEHYKKS